MTHTETLITFLGLCVHKPELAIWVLDQVPGYFNEVPCLGVHYAWALGRVYARRGHSLSRLLRPTDRSSPLWGQSHQAEKTQMGR